MKVLKAYGRRSKITRSLAAKDRKAHRSQMS